MKDTCVVLPVLMDDMRIECVLAMYLCLQIKHRLHTMRVELYNGYDDRVRYAFEIILSMWIYGMLLYTGYQMYQTHKEKGHFVKVKISTQTSVNNILSMT